MQRVTALRHSSRVSNVEFSSAWSMMCTIYSLRSWSWYRTRYLYRQGEPNEADARRWSTKYIAGYRTLNLDTILRYIHSLDHALKKLNKAPLSLDAKQFKFKSWAGRNRDWNPYATPEMTRIVIAVNLYRALSLYLSEIKTVSFLFLVH